MTIDRPDLSGAFTAERVDRAAALTGLLPASRPRTSTPHPPTGTLTVITPTPSTTRPVTPVEQPTATQTRRSKPQQTPKPTPVSETATLTTNVAVYLEPDLLLSTRTAIRDRNTTYDQLVVHAFDTVDQDQLRAALTRFETPTSIHMPARARRVRGTAGIQIQLRLTSQQRNWLDEQQQQLGAPSRSALVAAVLRLHLYGTPGA